MFNRKKLLFFTVWILVTAVLASCGKSANMPDDANPVIAAFAEKNNIPYSFYPESLINLLERNPEATDFVLQYPILSQQRKQVDMSKYANSNDVPLFLQWDTQWGYLRYGDDVAGITGCGPICLSMAAYYLTGSDRYAPHRIIEYAETNGYYSPGNGSSWTLISEGGEKLGFQVTELPLDKDRIYNCLENEIPVIFVVGPGDFTTSGHFLVMTGVENGMLKINDPNSVENSNKLWDFEQIKGQIRNLWSIEN